MKHAGHVEIWGDNSIYVYGFVFEDASEEEAKQAALAWAIGRLNAELYEAQRRKEPRR